MENLVTKLDKINMSDEAEEAVEDVDLKWGMNIIEIYKLSLKFYKGDKKIFCLRKKNQKSFKFILDKSGKGFHLTYEDNLKLVALTMQASHGSLAHQPKLEPLGVFDVIGRDRRNQWALLGKTLKLNT